MKPFVPGQVIHNKRVGNSHYLFGRSLTIELPQELVKHFEKEYTKIKLLFLETRKKKKVKSKT